jgi:S1-C subfamily serine protease
MRTPVLSVSALLCLAAAAAPGDVTPAIVTVYTTYQEADWSQPWQMRAAATRTGSGCIVAGRRVLTNAHVVGDRTFLQVRRAGQADKFVAEVDAVSHELDLALLRVDDESFFEGADPLPVGELPRIGDQVMAYGFPAGGSRVTITQGVVSRIDLQYYAHSGHDNVVCQIDAAINPGSSGGPVLDGQDRIVGVAFQLAGGQNIGYAVPAPVVRHFLDDLADGRLHGAPLLPAAWQYLENRDLRDFLGLPPGESGVLVRRLFPGATGLRPRDVILNLDGCDVGNDGTIDLRGGDRIALKYAIDRRQVGESVPVIVRRDGERVKLDVELTISKTAFPYVVPRHAYEAKPSYYVFGGLVFSPLTSNYFGKWDDWEDAPLPLRKFWYEPRTEENAWRQQVVVCIGVLADRLNAGYSWAEDCIVDKVDGKRIGSMRDLVAAFESRDVAHHRIVFEPDDYEVVLSHATAVARAAEVLSRYGVPADRSPDLR